MSLGIIQEMYLTNVVSCCPGYCRRLFRGLVIGRGSRIAH